LPSSVSPFPRPRRIRFANNGQQDPRPDVLVIRRYRVADRVCDEREQWISGRRGLHGETVTLCSPVFDIILLDWVLPHCDGLEVLALRARRTAAPDGALDASDRIRLG
jgi:CheY-like chemotaxis protein